MKHVCVVTGSRAEYGLLKFLIKKIQNDKTFKLKLVVTGTHLSKKYGNNTVVTYFGDTSTDDRQKAIKKIQDKESPVRFIIGTPQTGGYGITLTGASTMIYYSNGYDLEKRMQSEARINRIGQEKPMTYIDIMAEDTIDDKIVKSLRNKVNIATEIMGEELKAWI